LYLGFGFSKLGSNAPIRFENEQRYWEFATPANDQR